METYFLWGSIAVLVLFLLIGMITGLVRGLKRSSLHIIFLVASVIVSFFITKPIVNAVLGIQIPIDGQNVTLNEYIMSMLEESFNFDMSQLETASEFIAQLPTAIASPIIFLLLSLLVYFVFDIIYLIVARISFGKKKKDFKTHKPYRAYGGIVGIVEGFLFLVVLFAPLTSLTKTYDQIAHLPTETAQAQNEGENTSNRLPTLAETLTEVVPTEVDEILTAYNNSVVGKVSYMWGFGDVLFDGLANCNIEGENIEVRKEILSLANIYDDVVVVYNNAIDKNYENIDLTEFRKDLEVFLNNGLFKTVISETLNDIVVNFDSFKESLNLTEVPQVVQDMISDLQTVFSLEDFETYQYLKNDILSIVDTVDIILKNDMISKVQNLQDASMVDILNFIDENSQVVKTVAEDVIGLNLVRDTFNTLVVFASDSFEEMFENNQSLEIALNTNIQDREKMIDDILLAVDQILEINSVVDIASIVESDDILQSIASIENLDSALTTVGQTLDNLREMELLVLPAGDNRPQTVYVLDNILSLYNFDLLGDEVYLTPEAESTTTIDSYEEFFNFIKTPILEIKDLGLLDVLGQETIEFDTILDNVLTGLQENEELLSDILLPFYQLEAMDLKKLVFDNVVNILSDPANTNDLIDFTAVTEEAQIAEKNGVGVWHEELTYIGQTLKALDKDVTIGEQTQSYLDALLGGSELDTVLDALIESENDLEAVLDPVFSSLAFEGLTTQVFDTIDSTIESVLGMSAGTVQTSLENLEETKSNVISTIKTLLGITSSSEELTLQDLGTLLDALKANAYNGGTKDGVFNDVFAAVIYYMTGDDITSTDKFVGQATNDNATDIKIYLDIAETDDFVGYYTVESYADVMAEVNDTLDFATTLSENLSSFTELTLENVDDYFTALKDTINGVVDKTNQEKANMINKLADLIQGNQNRDELLTEQQKTDFGDTILEAIDEDFIGEQAEIGTALKNLLGLQ